MCVNIVKKFIVALEKLYSKSNFNMKGFIVGEEWISKGKGQLKRILLASRVTRKVIIKAAQENVKLIVSIYPPTFTQGFDQKIDNPSMNLLKIIMENKIAVFSLGKKWLIA